MTANKTWVYTYDRRGNILSRKTYAYTTGTLGTVQDTDTYEYFEQSSEYLWGDGLLRYDGTEYNFYDAIGKLPCFPPWARFQKIIPSTF